MKKALLKYVSQYSWWIHHFFFYYLPIGRKRAPNTNTLYRWWFVFKSYFLFIYCYLYLMQIWYLLLIPPQNHRKILHDSVVCHLKRVMAIWTRRSRLSIKSNLICIKKHMHTICTSLLHIQITFTLKRLLIVFIEGSIWKRTLYLNGFWMKYKIQMYIFYVF